MLNDVEAEQQSVSIGSSRSIVKDYRYGLMIKRSMTCHGSMLEKKKRGSYGVGEGSGEVISRDISQLAGVSKGG